MQRSCRSCHIFVRQLDAMAGQVSSFSSIPLPSFTSGAVPQAIGGFLNNQCQLHPRRMIISFTASAAVHTEVLIASL